MTAVLIDTSAWVDFFRGLKSAVQRVDPLLEEGRAAICGPILAEVISGTTSRAEFDRLGAQLRSLVWLAEPEDIWERTGEARFALARQGVQAHLIDLHIAQTALTRGARLLTRDQDFKRIGRMLPVELDLF